MLKRVFRERLRSRDRAKQRRKEAKEFGLCQWCLRASPRDSTYCTEHTRQHNRVQRSRYWEARNAGLCIACRINPTNGRVRCEECHIKSLEHNRRYKANAKR